MNQPQRSTFRSAAANPWGAANYRGPAVTWPSLTRGVDFFRSDPGRAWDPPLTRPAAAVATSRVGCECWVHSRPGPAPPRDASRHRECSLAARGHGALPDQWVGRLDTRSRQSPVSSTSPTARRHQPSSLVSDLEMHRRMPSERGSVSGCAAVQQRSRRASRCCRYEAPQPTVRSTWGHCWASRLTGFRYPPRRDVVPILVPIRPPVARGEANVDPSSPWLRSSGAGGSYALMRPSRRAFAGRIKNAPDRAPPVIRPASTPPTTGGAPGTSIGHWCPWSRRPARTVAGDSSSRQFACPGRTGRAATLPDARGRR